MKRNFISCALCALPMFFAGCYSTEKVTKEKLVGESERADVTLVTKDSTRYLFLKGNYIVRGDSLAGFGLRTRGSDSEIVLDASLSLTDVLSIETEQFNSGKTVLLGAGIGIGALVLIKYFFFNHTTEPSIAPSGAGAQ